RALARAQAARQGDRVPGGGGEPAEPRARAAHRQAASALRSTRERLDRAGRRRRHRAAPGRLLRQGIAPGGRGRLHRRQAPQRSDRHGDARRPAPLLAVRRHGRQLAVTTVYGSDSHAARTVYHRQRAVRSPSPWLSWPWVVLALGLDLAAHLDELGRRLGTRGVEDHDDPDAAAVGPATDAQVEALLAAVTAAGDATEWARVDVGGIAGDETTGRERLVELSLRIGDEAGGSDNHHHVARGDVAVEGGRAARGARQGRVELRLHLLHDTRHAGVGDLRPSRQGGGCAHPRVGRLLNLALDEDEEGRDAADTQDQQHRQDDEDDLECSALLLRRGRGRGRRCRLLRDLARLIRPRLVLRGLV